METPDTQQVQPVNTRSVGIRFGLTLGAIAAILLVVTKFAGMDDLPGFVRAFALAATVTVIIFAHKQFKDKGPGRMTFGEGFSIVLWIGIISSSILGVVSYMYYRFFAGTYFQELTSKVQDELENQNHPEEQMEMMEKLVGYMMTPEAFFVGGILKTMIYILLIGLIVTIFTKREHSIPAA